jgi:2-dehydropantoate 2-reductase
MKKICVFGAGAVGGYIAARLARAGLDVAVVARGPQLAAIKKNGLRLIDADGDFTVQVTATNDPAELGAQDLVISTVKAQMLGDAALHMQPLLAKETPVVCAVNGIPWWYFHGLSGDAESRLPRLDPQGLLWRHIGAGRVLGCVIRSPNEIVEPGVVKNNTKNNQFRIGELDGTLSPRLQAVTEALATGLPGTSATTDIRADIWNKLLINIPSSLLSALTISRSFELFRDPGVLDIYCRIADETCQVAAKYGVHMHFDVDAQAKHAESNRHPPSMLQDLIAGRPLELDAQALAIQDLARQADVPTPALDMTIALLAQRDRSEFAAELR